MVAGPRVGAPDRAPCTLAPSTAVPSSSCARPRPRACGDCRGAPHHFALEPLRGGGYDPVFRVNPPLRTTADVAAVKAGLVDGTIDAVATDHAPMHPRRRTRPSTRPRRRSLGSSPPWRSPSPSSPAHGPLSAREVLALFTWRPAAIAVSARTMSVGRPQRPRGRSCPVRRPTCVSSTRPSAGRSTPPPWRAAAAHPYAGRPLLGRVRHTVLRGEPVVSIPRCSGERARPIGRRPRAHLVLADGEVFSRARRQGHCPKGRGHRRAGLQYALSATRSGHRPLVCRPDGGIHHDAHRQLRHQRHRDEAGRPHLLGVSCATSPSRRPMALEQRASRPLGAPRYSGHHRHRQPAGSPPPAHRRRHALCLRHRGIDTVRTAAGSPVGPMGATSWPGDGRPEAYRVGEGPFHVVAYDFGNQDTMVRHLGAMARVTVSPPPPAPTKCSPSA